MRKTHGEATDDQLAPSEDGDGQILLPRELNAALTVIKGRTQVLRRRLRQRDDSARLEADLEAIETELTRLTTLVARSNRGDGE